MKAKRSSARQMINGIVPRTNMPTTSNTVYDLDEVLFLETFDNSTPAVRSCQPLIDIVNPQPKAFFAYLRMPKPADTKPKKKVASKRISRKARNK